MSTPDEWKELLRCLEAEGVVVHLDGDGRLVVPRIHDGISDRARVGLETIRGREVQLKRFLRDPDPVVEKPKTESLKRRWPRRTHCRRGHPWTDATVKRFGIRHCGVCERERAEAKALADPPVKAEPEPASETPTCPAGHEIVGLNAYRRPGHGTECRRCKTQRALKAKAKKRRAAAHRTHCKRGHLLDERGTYTTRTGARRCRKCCAKEKAKPTRPGPPRRTHCQRGHLLTDDNIYVSARTFRRRCRECVRRRDRLRKKLGDEVIASLASVEGAR